MKRQWQKVELRQLAKHVRWGALCEIAQSDCRIECSKRGIGPSENHISISVSKLWRWTSRTCKRLQSPDVLRYKFIQLTDFFVDWLAQFQCRLVAQSVQDMCVVYEALRFGSVLELPIEIPAPLECGKNTFVEFDEFGPNDAKQFVCSPH